MRAPDLRAPAVAQGAGISRSAVSRWQSTKGAAWLGRVAEVDNVLFGAPVTSNNSARAGLVPSGLGRRPRAGEAVLPRSTATRSSRPLPRQRAWRNRSASNASAGRRHRGAGQVLAQDAGSGRLRLIVG